MMMEALVAVILNEAFVSPKLAAGIVHQRNRVFPAIHFCLKDEFCCKQGFFVTKYEKRIQSRISLWAS